MRHPEKQARPDTPLLAKPPWLRVRAPGSAGYNETRRIVRAHGLVTVCEEAACPNIGECWSVSHASMMIMGATCTRACAFCNVITGLPGPLDEDEPARTAVFEKYRSRYSGGLDDWRVRALLVAIDLETSSN